jgi:hypothetical protein
MNLSREILYSNSYYRTKSVPCNMYVADWETNLVPFFMLYFLYTVYPAPAWNIPSEQIPVEPYIHGLLYGNISKSPKTFLH